MCNFNVVGPGRALRRAMPHQLDSTTDINLKTSFTEMPARCDAFIRSHFAEERGCLEAA